jgi:hypothetical protein
MPFEIKYFRNMDRIIADKNMANTVTETLSYVDLVLYGNFFRGSNLRTALEEMGWRDNEELTIIPGRRYQFKGLINSIAIEASLYSYEGLWNSLFRLQVGFDKGLIEGGLVIVNGERSAKSPIGSSWELAQREVDLLHPTVNLPVALAVFDFGVPTPIADDEQIVIPKDDDFDDVIDEAAINTEPQPLAA